MLIMHVGRALRSAAVASAFIVATGCANLAPVKTFADETKKVAAAFDPLTASTVETCITRRENKVLISTTKPFDATKVKEDATKLCAPVAEGNKYIAEVAGLLEQYADTLAALADDKLPNYKDQFTNLKTAVNGVKIDGKEIIPKDKVNAITSLGEFIARLVTQRIAAREAKALLDQQVGFDAAADALSEYVRLIYKPYATDNRRDMLILVKDLDEQERTEPLAARGAKVALRDEVARMDAAIKTANNFEATVARLKAARAEVRAKLDNEALTPDQLFALVEDVRELRKQLIAAF